VSIRRDYKRTTAGQRRKTVVRCHGLLVVTLILMGLFGGLLAYIKVCKPPSASTTAALPAAAPSKTPSVLAEPPGQATPPVTVIEPMPVKPKYDFYTELPKRQIDIQRGSDRSLSSSQPSRVRTQTVAGPPRKPVELHKITAAPAVAVKSP
jgi:hypothetical protein